jgi:hypothetical protein
MRRPYLQQRVLRRNKARIGAHTWKSQGVFIARRIDYAQAQILCHRRGFDWLPSIHIYSHAASPSGVETSSSNFRSSVENTTLAAVGEA